MFDLGIFSAYPGYSVYSNYVTLVCPYHDDTKPSLLAYNDGWFTCLACETSGSLERLQKKLEGGESSTQYLNYSPQAFRPAIRGSSLNDYEIFTETAHDVLERYPEMGWYMKLRGVDSRILPNRIGWNDGWYTFPIYDRQLTFKCFVMRADPHVQYRTDLRYWIPPNQSINMFAPDWRLLETEKRIYVVFGIIDALALSALRYPVVTTSGGKSSFQAEWLRDYRKQIIIVPDKGEIFDGFKLTQEIGYRAKVARLPYPDEFKDPADFLQHGKGYELQCMLEKF